MRVNHTHGGGVRAPRGAAAIGNRTGPARQERPRVVRGTARYSVRCTQYGDMQSAVRSDMR
ncbi:hypothetical protein [Streptomyces sp. NPDC017941]|uniref:hypothetical protein n=1 Tax=Streptomyces sp. NPDC017941 TaxID=3365018 RepID=UPI0037937324